MKRFAKVFEYTMAMFLFMAITFSIICISVPVVLCHFTVIRPTNGTTSYVPKKLRDFMASKVCQGEKSRHSGFVLLDKYRPNSEFKNTYND